MRTTPRRSARSTTGRATTKRSTPRRAAIAAVAALLIALVAPATAQAQDAYRFWGYYQWDGTEWVFAQTGPADSVPEDGAVEGWRFAVSDESTPRFPRADGDFETLCADVVAADGLKRVAVVVDPGTAEDSPDGTEPPLPSGGCAILPEDATGDQLLTAVASTRVEGGLVCAIDDYPGTGCGDAVAGPAPTEPDEQVELAPAEGPAATPGDSPGEPTADPAATPTEDATGVAATTDDDGFPIALVAGLAAVAAVGTAAFVIARRNREQDEAA
jgi:hypothetical protein